MILDADQVPRSRPEIPVFACVVAWLECVSGDLGSWEVGDGISTRLAQERDVFVVRDPLTAEANPHPSA
jgi:hypothetical protein